MERERQENVNEARHRGPNLGAVSVVYTVLFLASLVETAIMTNGGHIPSPFIAPDLIQAFFARNADAVRIAAFLQFGAAVPLGIFTATVVSRLQFLGMNVAGVSITLFGGFAASLFSAISAVLQWTLAQPGVASQSDNTRVLHLLGFATGPMLGRRPDLPGRRQLGGVRRSRRIHGGRHSREAPGLDPAAMGLRPAEGVRITARRR